MRKREASFLTLESFGRLKCVWPQKLMTREKPVTNKKGKGSLAIKIKRGINQK